MTAASLTVSTVLQHLSGVVPFGSQLCLRDLLGILFGLPMASVMLAASRYWRDTAERGR